MTRDLPINKIGIPEDAATGRTADGYRQIREQLGVPFVPTIYRILAQCPEPFDRAVDALAEVVDVVDQTNFAIRVREHARLVLAETSCCRPLDADFPSRFEAVMEGYAAANPIGLMFSLSIVGLPVHPHPGVMDATIPASPTGDLREDIVACHGDMILPGFWRDTMEWPTLAQRLWLSVRTHAREGNLERARISILDFAKETASGTAFDAMAEELRPLMPADLIEILEWFPTGISTMIAEVEWLMESLLRRPRAAPQT